MLSPDWRLQHWDHGPQESTCNGTQFNKPVTWALSSSIRPRRRGSNKPAAILSMASFSVSTLFSGERRTSDKVWSTSMLYHHLSSSTPEWLLYRRACSHDRPPARSARSSAWFRHFYSSSHSDASML